MTHIFYGCLTFFRFFLPLTASFPLFSRLFPAFFSLSYTYFHCISYTYSNPVSTVELTLGIYAKLLFQGTNLLDFPRPGGYNGCVPGMTENTFPPQRLKESMRSVRAYEPRMKYHLPTDGGSRPLPRGDKRSANAEASGESGQQGWNRGRRKEISRSSLHFT